MCATRFFFGFFLRAEQDADITDLFKVLNITDAAQINALFHDGA